MDPSKTLQEQNFSTTTITKLAIDMPKSKHKAMSGTPRFLSRIKCIGNMSKQRHKTNIKHFHFQHTDPPLSSPGMVQTVTPQLAPNQLNNSQQLSLRADVHFTHTFPKDLLSDLEQGHELHWSQITRHTLKEFSYIDETLQLTALLKYLQNHSASRQAASSQLLQATRSYI